MFRTMLIASGLLGLSACVLGDLEKSDGEDPDAITLIEWHAAYTADICELIFECTREDLIEYLPWSDAEQCIAVGGTADAAECAAFDPVLGEECLDGTSTMTCEEYDVGSFPPSCEAVCGQ